MCALLTQNKLQCLLPACLSASLSVCLSMRPSAHLSVAVFICKFVCCLWSRDTEQMSALAGVRHLQHRLWLWGSRPVSEAYNQSINLANRQRATRYAQRRQATTPNTTARNLIWHRVRLMWFILYPPPPRAPCNRHSKAAAKELCPKPIDAQLISNCEAANGF